MTQKDVKSVEDFFEYLVDYMADGDTLECETLSDENGEEYNKYTLYGGGFSHYPLISFDRVDGVQTY